MNIKCNICGGDVSLSADKTFATCEYCGSTITVPKVSDEQRAAAFNRGNHFRRIGEFDKALASYERILRDDDTDAEAHWCAALCRFGIEYVEDPATYEWIPTCHRASFDSFTEDVDYKAALEHSDGLTRRLYQKEAAKIAEVQKGILATSQNEEPYDVFLCYKETGEDGQRTKDSILAQDIYYQLTDQGHRVFFSRITLEDKAGSQYEPYIFAALNSAKVMVAVGTKPEHFSAVWVKNEWSRFLALMRRDRSRVLLPCYRDMDPYDLPEQLAVLQSYDMGKIGFIQDLIRGVDKVVKSGKTETAPVVQTADPVVIQQSTATNTAALVKRGYMALEDGEWKKADDFFEQALNLDAELAEAYLGKFLAQNHAKSLDDLSLQLAARTDKASVIRKEACPRDMETENRAVQQYTVLGYLDAAAIRSAFAFDRTFESVSSSRKKQLDEMQSIWTADKNLNRAEQFADAQLKGQIAQCRSSVLSVLETRLAEALESDTNNTSNITGKYAQKLTDAQETIRSLYPRKLEEKQKHEAEQRRILEERRRQEEERKKVAAERLKLQKQREIESEYLKQGSTWMYRASIAETHANKVSCLESALEKFEAANAKGSIEDCKKKLTVAKYILNGVCEHCGGKFVGIFMKRCSVCGKYKEY